VATNGPSKAVFLSYASQDAEAARRICEALRAGAIEVWFDQSELRSGDLWDRQIRQHINDCALFIPLISAGTQSRPEGYFRLEWRLAVERTHLMSERVSFLVPVVIDPLNEREVDVPAAFRAAQWTRLIGGETPPAFVDRIARLLSPVAASSATTAAVVRPIQQSGPPRLALYVGGILLAAVAGYFAVEKWVLPNHTADVVAGTSAKITVAAPGVVGSKSIAVLPFVNMSSDKEQEYFSDGLAEELIDLLAKTPGLHVIARASSFYFKGKQVTLAEIAKTLGVANILEGSVRKSGDHLRIGTQLVAADSGEELWSEHYDREVKDVFKVQDEIAGAVVAALRLKLASAPAPADRGTTSTAAYEQLLLGKQFFNESNPEGWRRAIEAYDRAIALDPNYAAAYAGLASAQHYLDDFTGEAAGLSAVTAAANKAVTLAPELAVGYEARGYLRMTAYFDWAGAEADLSKALALNPNDSTTLRHHGILLASLGRLPEAIAAMKKALDADPLSEAGWSGLALFLTASGDFAGSNDAVVHALAINPNSMYALENRSELLLLTGHADEALTTFRGSKEEVFRLYGTAMAEHTLGHDPESREALKTLVDKYGKEAAYQIAEAYAWRGETDHAFEWLERARVQRDAGLSSVKFDPFLRSLHSDPRYHVLLRMMELPD
jgi:TolB-like protein/lipoprotein NlpI